jgi:methylated-DNA-protein-cysteine methyltransferase related protein
MTETITSDFRDKVFALIKRIPEGKVMTYGQVALLIGSPGAARQVGMALRGLGDDLDNDIPWQRVINAQGGISTYKVGTGELQKALLESEGVVVNTEGKMDLKKYQWWPDEEDKAHAQTALFPEL